MLEYTKAAFKKTMDDLYAFFTYYQLAVQIFSIGYLIYALVAPAGNLYANIVLLSASAAYLVFFSLTEFNKIKIEARIRREIKKLFRRLKLVIKAFTVGLMLYGIYIATTHLTAVSAILAALTVVGFTLQLLFELLLYALDCKFKLILSGIEADIEQLIKPAATVGNFIKKISGKEIEPEKEPDKNRKLLNKVVYETRERRKREKEARKNERLEMAARKKAERIALRETARTLLGTSAEHDSEDHT